MDLSQVVERLTKRRDHCLNREAIDRERAANCQRLGNSHGAAQITAWADKYADEARAYQVAIDAVKEKQEREAETFVYRHLMALQNKALATPGEAARPLWVAWEGLQALVKAQGYVATAATIRAQEAKGDG